MIRNYKIYTYNALKAYQKDLMFGDVVILVECETDQVAYVANPNSIKLNK